MDDADQAAINQHCDEANQAIDEYSGVLTNYESILSQLDCIQFPDFSGVKEINYQLKEVGKYSDLGNLTTFKYTP